MYGVFKKGDANDNVTLGAVVSLALVAALVIFTSEGKVTAFGGAFVVDTFARVMKVWRSSARPWPSSCRPFHEARENGAL